MQPSPSSSHSHKVLIPIRSAKLCGALKHEKHRGGLPCGWGREAPKEQLYAHGETRYGKQAVPLAYAVVRLIRESGLPVRSITTDNGPEFAAHEIIARELNTKVYFAHPYCTWEKGAIENMNGLIRQYIPKKTDFRGILRLYVKNIIEKLNNRSRKKNGFRKPKDMINEIIA